MSAVLEQNSMHSAARAIAPVVVVGTGPVGIHFAGIQNPLQLPLGHHVVQHHNCAIVAIDLPGCRVRDQLGNWQPYSRLVLATGSATPLISPPSTPTSVSHLPAFPVTTATRTRPGVTSSWAT